MGKKQKIFINVLYYGFTFLIGFMLAIILPNMYMYSMSMTEIRTSLINGEYDKAMGMVGGYYNKADVYKNIEEHSGIVIFEAATLVYNSGEEDDETVDETKLQKSYAGYFFMTNNDYDIWSNEENKAVIKVENTNGATLEYSILDYDSDGDGTIDTMSTYFEKGFIYFDLGQEKFTSIAKISFVDKDGITYKEYIMDLKYDGAFFNDVDDFLNEYNLDYNSEKLVELDEQFLSKNGNYQKSSYGDIQSKAMGKAVKLVLLYFVVIYLIGDTLFGAHYLIKFGKFILVKVFKVKFKEKKAKEEKSFGNDYYSMVTISLDLSEVPDFSGSVVVRYQSTNEVLEFNLLKSNNYTTQKRVKAGVYPNPWIELDEHYKALDLPENLNIEGYRKSYVVKIINNERK